MPPVHLALVIGHDPRLTLADPTPTGPSERRIAVDRYAEKLAHDGAFVRRFFSSHLPDDEEPGEPATQLSISGALDALAEGAKAGARITIVYCGETQYNAKRGLLIRARDTAPDSHWAMWSAEDLLARFPSAAAPVSIIIEGTPVPERPPRGGSIEWDPQTDGTLSLDILNNSNQEIGHVLVTGANYVVDNTRPWEPSKDYWFWQTASPWPDHFKIRWSENQDNIDHLDNLDPDEVYPMSAFASDNSTPPSNPVGKLYRVTRKVGSETSWPHLYLHHTGTGSNATTEWWANNLDLKPQQPYLFFPDTHVHIFDRITSPPATPPTNRHISTQSSD